MSGDDQMAVADSELLITVASTIKLQDKSDEAQYLQRLSSIIHNNQHLDSIL